jgi:arginyl-tRNA synthetase
VLDNPAYAVRYAHAAAAAVLRWTGTPPGDFRPGRLAPPGDPARPELTRSELTRSELTRSELTRSELTLLDALSWLPERAATAARRGRPEVFARYLATLASRTIDSVNTSGFTLTAAISSERLWLAAAARTALGTGLGCLGISAPDRL